MTKLKDELYTEARTKCQQAFQLCLEGELDEAQAMLHTTRTILKGLSGDLPIVRYGKNPENPDNSEDPRDSRFSTSSFLEAQAWGWLELASGVFQLVRGWPGGSLVHFLRAWRIWRPWTADSSQMQEALRERVRASLWLGEGWSRIMSERAEHAARAVLRAALTEIAHIEAIDLLAETIAQQSLLPPAPRGSPAYKKDGTSTPYVIGLVEYNSMRT